MTKYHFSSESKKHKFKYVSPAYKVDDILNLNDGDDESESASQISLNGK